MSSLSETAVYEPHFQVQHGSVTKETMLELPKRDLKELPGWAMHVLSATRSRNRVMNFKFRQWISTGSSEAKFKRRSCNTGYTETEHSLSNPVSTK